MSTGWYFHTFNPDRFRKLCGSATPEQTHQLVEVVTNPDQTGWDISGDEYKLAERVSLELCSAGLTYKGKDRTEAMMLDHVVTMIFSHMGMAGEMQCRPVSGEPLDVNLADELAKAAAATPDSLIRFLARGRRAGESESTGRCNYLILNQAEISRMKDEMLALAKDVARKWRQPQMPRLAADLLLPPLESALADPSLEVFARAT